MKKKYLDRKIDYHLEIRRNLWTAMLILAGGLATLIINPDNFIKIMLIIRKKQKLFTVMLSTAKHRKIQLYCDSSAKASE